MNQNNVKIGFAYDAPVGKYTSEGLESETAEYEDEQTITWLRTTLQGLGDVVDLPWGPDIVARVGAVDVDLIFNITEATGGRNRESLIPALAEARGIPYTGTDALGLGLSLDKHLTKVLARHLGVSTPRSVHVVSADGWEAIRADLLALRFPVIVKPRHGGSSLGIRAFSRVTSPAALEEVVRWTLDSFADTVLVEEFIRGREFTVGLLETPELTVLPIAEMHLGDGDPNAFFSYEVKNVPNKEEVICPAVPPDGAGERMVDDAIRLFRALACRDMARVDFRVDGEGRPHCLEINPLPGLSPYYSSLPAQAEAAGISPEALIAQLVENALARGRRSE